MLLDFQLDTCLYLTVLQQRPPRLLSSHVLDTQPSMSHGAFVDLSHRSIAVNVGDCSLALSVCRQESTNSELQSCMLLMEFQQPS